MSEDLEKVWLAACQRQLEEKLQWGPIAQWAQRDFENLSELISEKTGVMISVTTLKRALGRVEFKGMPFHTTLNALVQFLGYPDWAHFKAQPEHIRHPEASPMPALATRTTGMPTWGYWTLGALGIAHLIWLGLFVSNGTGFLAEPEPEPEAGSWLRSTDATADSVPHTVHFEYFVPEGLRNDVTLLSYGDEKGIQYANFDAQGHGHVSHRFSEYGYYPVKLFANKRMVALTPVLIAHPEWLTSLHIGTKVDKVLKPTLRQGVLTLAENEVFKLRDDTLARISTRFRAIRSFGVTGDDCRLVIRLRCPANSYNGQQPKVGVKLACENDAAYYTLDKSATAKDIFHKVSDHLVPVDQQLKLFVHDISDWSLLEYECHQQQYTFRLNGKIIYQAMYQRELGPLYGIHLSFRGIGEIDQVQLYDGSNKLRYREEF